MWTWDVDTRTSQPIAPTANSVASSFSRSSEPGGDTCFHGNTLDLGFVPDGVLVDDADGGGGGCGCEAAASQSPAVER